jgi:hypothetical protein
MSTSVFLPSCATRYAQIPDPRDAVQALANPCRNIAVSTHALQDEPQSAGLPDQLGVKISVDNASSSLLTVCNISAAPSTIASIRPIITARPTLI